MSLVVLLLEALVYSFHLAIVLITWFSAHRLSSGSSERARLSAWTRVMLGALGIAGVFFMQQTSYLMRSWVDTNSFWLVFDIGTEIAFVFATLLSMLLFERFFALAANRRGTPGIKLAVRIALAVLGSLYLVSLFVNLPVSEARLLAGYGVGWSEIPSLGAGLVFMLLLVFYYKCPELESVRFLNRGLVWVIIGTIALELLIYFIPESFWSKAVFSRYLFETIIIYAGFLAVSLGYVLKEGKYGVFNPDEGRGLVGPDGLAGTASSQTTVIELCASLELSARETEVVRCLLEGKSNQDIADSLYISMSTVKTHLHRILEKTGQPSRTALVAWFVRKGSLTRE